MATATKKVNSVKLPEVPASIKADKELDEIWVKAVETTDGTSLNFLKDTLLGRINDKKNMTYSPECLNFLTKTDEEMAEYFIEDWIHVGNTDAVMNLMEAIYNLKVDYRMAFSAGSKTSPWWDKF